MLRIGIYGHSWGEIVARPVSGVIRAAADSPEIVVCDCRVRNLANDIDHPPPWRGRVDGMILSVGLGDAKSVAEVADWFTSGGVPFVSMSGDTVHPRIPTVCLEPKSIARLAVRHLVELGCRRFVYVGFRDSVGSGRRAEAFEKALAGSGRTMTALDVRGVVEEFEDRFSVASDVRLVKRELARGPFPIGVLTLGDSSARAVYTLCTENDIEVPSRVAIVGVNDLPFASTARPTITSIRYPGEAVGRRALQLLLELLDGKRAPRRPIGVPATELFPRQSTLGNVDPDERFVAGLRLIALEACHGLNVTRLVDVLAVSRRWLELEFQRRLGRSPLQEINRVRVARAKELLQSTRIPVHQIATIVGFVSAPALSNFFRKHTNLSPSEYREWCAREILRKEP